MGEITTALITKAARKTDSTTWLYILTGPHEGERAILDHAAELPPYVRKNTLVRINGCYVRRGKALVLRTKHKNDITLEMSAATLDAFRRNIKKVFPQQMLELASLADTAKMAAVLEKQPVLDGMLDDEQRLLLRRFQRVISTTDLNKIYEIMESAGLGLDIDRVALIYDTLKYRAGHRHVAVHELIREHPWLICQVEGINRATAQKLAENLGKARSSPETQLYSYAMAVVWHAARNGDCGMPLKEVHRKTRGLQEKLMGAPVKESVFQQMFFNPDLMYGTVYGRAVCCHQFEAEIKRDRLPLYLELSADRSQAEKKAAGDAKLLYPARVYFAERSAAELLAARIQQPPPQIDTAIPDGLDSDQLEAVRTALKNPVTVWAGQAGSGKSHTIIKMASALQQAGKQVVLLAPTAVAADRLSQKLPQATACTIHRFARIPEEVKDYLISEGVGNGAGPAVELAEEAIVFVDELSMCDMIAFSALLHSLKHKPARLVLAGDPEQLPPVGPGGLFDHFINILSKHIPVCRLTGNYRSDSLILSLARKVRNEGVFDCGHIDNKTIILHNNQPQADKIKEIAEQLKNSGYMLGQVLFVTPTRYAGGFGAGADFLAPVLREVWNPDGEEIPGTRLWVGDPVICVENDYADLNAKDSLRHPGRRVNIFNGYRGTVTRADGETVWVKFQVKGEEHEVPYTISELPYWLEQAYCVTVHKSQGGEWPVLVFIGQEGMHRQLVYTGFTRAQEKLVLVGKQEWWEQGAKTKAVPPLCKFGYRVLHEISRAVSEIMQSNCLCQVECKNN
ncbi:MAG: AAA family ATPase [Syntrophothermus sp.]|uniref:AAA family ATPase n=1 Tax=Syntrophothermus sp. TaxID=2736299 RepID=UPI00257FC94D|nr:AAA family ATPase [Syntrophothermus sp.]NSW84538.1 AAA family ATPase [Syntrophothermus sp.]